MAKMTAKKQNCESTAMATAFGAPCTASFCDRATETMNTRVLMDTAFAVSIFVFLPILTVVGLLVGFLIDVRVCILWIAIILFPMVLIIFTNRCLLPSKTISRWFPDMKLRMNSAEIQ